MDLSWCIICDRHCIDNNLYCSELCRFQDNTGHHHDNNKIKSITPEFNMFKSPSLVSPPSSPILTPFLYSFQPSHDRRRSTSAGSMQHASLNTSTYTNYQYFPYQLSPSSSSGSSIFGDDT
ncbi:hypothetical protein EDC94DRAFT_604806 [Helicostylum pulchrum]|uniref:Uncharacterized protein n=1 Tax=Helicostylum pulchrum TaxID=562976 RepID=A0ABP9XML2_9FUNG|nr:hypothetical protein EDC94DRAFT_604806 [Helicostylum pulchrum]